MTLSIKKKQLDAEWVKLIKEAKRIGLTKEEVKIFLTNCKENPVSQ